MSRLINEFSAQPSGTGFRGGKFTDSSWESFERHHRKSMRARMVEEGILDSNSNGDTRMGDWPRLERIISRAAADTYQPNHSADRGTYHTPCPHGKPYIPQLPIASHLTSFPQESWRDFYLKMKHRLIYRTEEEGIFDSNPNGDARSGDWPRLLDVIARAFADCYGRAHQDDRGTYHPPHGGHSGSFRSDSWGEFNRDLNDDLQRRTVEAGILDSNPNGDTRSGDWPRLQRVISRASADVFGRNHRDNRATHHGAHGGH